MTSEQAEWKLMCVAEAFLLAPHALCVAGVREIVKAQVPSRRLLLARAIILALAGDVIRQANGTASLAAENLAATIIRVAEPVETFERATDIPSTQRRGIWDGGDGDGDE